LGNIRPKGLALTGKGIDLNNRNLKKMSVDGFIFVLKIGTGKQV
jgi:hypothetical protein